MIRKVHHLLVVPENASQKGRREHSRGLGSGDGEWRWKVGDGEVGGGDQLCWEMGVRMSEHGRGDKQENETQSYPENSRGTR